MDIPQFTLSQWTFGYLHYYEKCYYEYLCQVFVWIYIFSYLGIYLEWNCWVIW